MQELELSGLFVAPVAMQISEWFEAGKLGEDDLDRLLTPNARSIVDSPSESLVWVPLADVESMLSIVAEQRGSGAGVVEWADTIAASWVTNSDLSRILSSAQTLVDGAAYMVTQACGLLVRGADWQLEGGRDRFSVWIYGLEMASIDLTTLLAALLARAAGRADAEFSDLRFEGIDAGELCIFGERQKNGLSGDAGKSRLHRAALVG